MEHIKTVDEFKKIIEENQNVVVDFFATWCGPCRMLSPIVEELEKEHSEIKFIKVDVDEAEELANMFSISSIPMLAYIKNQQGLLRELGYQSKDHLEANLKEIFG